MKATAKAEAAVAELQEQLNKQDELLNATADRSGSLDDIAAMLTTDQAKRLVLSRRLDAAQKKLTALQIDNLREDAVRLGKDKETAERAARDETAKVVATMKAWFGELNARELRECKPLSNTSPAQNRTLFTRSELEAQREVEQAATRLSAVLNRLGKLTDTPHGREILNAAL